MMAHNNLHKTEGFSFIEIAFTLLIFALVMTTLLAQQGRLFERATSSFNAWRAMVALKNYHHELERTEELTENTYKKKDPHGDFNLDVTIKKPHEQSVLKDVANLFMVRAQAQWEEFGFSRTQNLLYLRAVQS